MGGAACGCEAPHHATSFLRSAPLFVLKSPRSSSSVSCAIFAASLLVSHAALSMVCSGLTTSAA